MEQIEIRKNQNRAMVILMIKNYKGGF